MKNWKLLAASLGLDIPQSDLEKIQPALDSLDAAFRPLTKEISHETEPAFTFSCFPEKPR